MIRYYLRNYTYENGVSHEVWIEIPAGYYDLLMRRGHGDDLKFEVSGK